MTVESAERASAIILRPKRESSLRRLHPWIFSGAIREVVGRPASGATVRVLSHSGEMLGHAAYSPRSQIRARIWSFGADDRPDHAWFRDRIGRSVGRRSGLWPEGDDGACRLVYGESDGLPGLIVDRYGDHLVVQFLAAGTEYWRDTIVAALSEVLSPAGIYERSDVDVRRKEGLEPQSGLLAGAEPPECVEIREGPVRHLVDLRAGHKTGFYLDQRENRARLAARAAGRRVLNVFSYTGGFGTAALCAGAESVLHLDTSASALDMARRSAERNDVDPERIETLEGDAFVELRRLIDERREFDLIVLDPPKFAASRAHLPRACRGYKDINRLGFGLLAPGGTLATFSCSGLLEPDLFQKVVADAALDAGRDARIVEWLGQAPDHPTALPFPEGRYLKGLACRAD